MLYTQCKLSARKQTRNVRIGLWSNLISVNEGQNKDKSQVPGL